MSKALQLLQLMDDMHRAAVRKLGKHYHMLTLPFHVDCIQVPILLLFCSLYISCQGECKEHVNALQGQQATAGISLEQLKAGAESHAASKQPSTAPHTEDWLLAG